jgi:hypothetical protein
MIWRHKDMWSLNGKNFMVQVSRHEEKGDSFTGPNRWCVYAYIYPKHPHFSKFEGSDMNQEAATALIFHAGTSLLTRHFREDGSIASIQVGADYNHLHDEEFTHMATKEVAFSIFEDVQSLFDQLTRLGEEA